MEKSQTAPMPGSKITDTDPAMQAKIAECHKRIGQSMVDTLKYNTTHADAPHRKGK